MATASDHLKAAEMWLDVVAQDVMDSRRAEPMTAVLMGLANAVIGLAYELGVPPPGPASTPTGPASVISGNQPAPG